MKTTRNVRVATRPERREKAASTEPAMVGPEHLPFRTVEEHAKEQPEMLKLQKILLSVGGKRVFAPPMVTDEISFLIEGGFAMDYPVTERRMRPHEFRLNSAELFATGK